MGVVYFATAIVLVGAFLGVVFLVIAMICPEEATSFVQWMNS